MGELLASTARTDTDLFVDYVQGYCQSRGWPVPDRKWLVRMLGGCIHTTIMFGAETAAEHFYNPIRPPIPFSIAGRVAGGTGPKTKQPNRAARRRADAYKRRKP